MLTMRASGEPPAQPTHGTHAAGEQATRLPLYEELYRIHKQYAILSPAESLRAVGGAFAVSSRQGAPPPKQNETMSWCS
jgi:hypothetical protein